MIAFKTKSMKEISRYIYSNWNNNSHEAYQIFTNSDFYRFTMRKLHYAIYNYLRYRSACKRVWFELRHPVKPMSVYDMTLALDRISRFKFPEKKLKRVYIETICAHLISPSFKKTDIEKFDNKSLSQLFCEIWNYSVKENDIFFTRTSYF